MAIKSQFFQKNSKNPLTDKDRVWYNSQAVRERAAGSLKIEQQEISTKRKKQVRISSKEVLKKTTLNKVKEKAKN